MPWAYIRMLLGSGLHWDHSRSKLLAAIERAEREGKPDAADHLRIILELRDKVMVIDFEKENPAE